MIGGIDTNILIYAHDNSSPFQTQALHLLENILEGSVVAVAELSLREFYAVVTDGRKLNNPFSIDEAKDIISDIYASPKFFVCSTNQETWLNGYELVGKYNISRYRLDDLLIALTLADGGAQIIYTANIKDFKKFDFIKAINPFSTFKTNETNSTNETKTLIPYGRQSIDEKDVAAVCSVLRSDWLTTGPKVAEFEQAVADYVGAKHAVAVSSGTAALHAAMYAIGIGPGDEVIVPPITFAASANCVVYQGGTPIFSDVEPDTLLLDPEQIESKITSNTKAIIAVDYAGHPCDYDSLRKIANKNNLVLVADACHALGGKYKGQKVGSLADLNIFSFHPVKHITTGEGGMITTDEEALANRMRLFRNHGITRDPKQFASSEEVSAPSAPRSMLSAPCSMPFYYEMADLGYNYRITDFQCALGISQLRKLPKFLERRREIAALYNEALADIPGIEPLGLRADVLPAKQAAMLPAPSSMPSNHAYHLYVVRLHKEKLSKDRGAVFQALLADGIGVNVHYIPVHLHPFYRKKFHTGPGLCPVAETAYEQIISLPMFPGMTDEDVKKVIEAVKKAIVQ